MDINSYVQLLEKKAGHNIERVTLVQVATIEKIRISNLILLKLAALVLLGQNLLLLLLFPANSTFEWYNGAGQQIGDTYHFIITHLDLVGFFLLGMAFLFHAVTERKVILVLGSSGIFGWLISRVCYQYVLPTLDTRTSWWNDTPAIRFLDYILPRSDVYPPPVFGVLFLTGSILLAIASLVVWRYIREDFLSQKSKLLFVMYACSNVIIVSLITFMGFPSSWQSVSVITGLTKGLIIPILGIMAFGTIVILDLTKFKRSWKKQKE